LINENKPSPSAYGKPVDPNNAVKAFNNVKPSLNDDALAYGNAL